MIPGEHVICVHRGEWRNARSGLSELIPGPSYGHECVIERFLKAGVLCLPERRVWPKAIVSLVGWPGFFDADEFIPKPDPLAEMIVRAADAGEPVDEHDLNPATFEPVS